MVIHTSHKIPNYTNIVPIFQMQSLISQVDSLSHNSYGPFKVIKRYLPLAGQGSLKPHIMYSSP